MLNCELKSYQITFMTEGIKLEISSKIWKIHNYAKISTPTKEEVTREISRYLETNENENAI